MHLPRLAQTLPRPRIALWFARHTHTPLRLLVAPAGSGKTTAVVSYLRTRGLPYLYHSLLPGATARDLAAALAAALNVDPPRGFEELKAALAAAGQLQVVLENVDVAAADAADWLRRLVDEAGENLTFIYTARAWTSLDASRLSAQGLAAICDSAMLAFDTAEVAAMAQMLGVDCSEHEADALREQCEGWPVVVAGAVREAFEHGRPLADAYDHWRKAQGTNFREFIEQSAASADSAAMEAWDCFIADGAITSQSAEQLRRAGLPFRRDLHGSAFPYRVMEQIFNGRLAAGTVAVQKTQPLVARALGEFHACVGEAPIKWIRRRDQQIFLYVLLKETGSATRAELCEQFWPGVEQELRAASLRVACSNIRRALASACGAERVDQYFRSDGDIAVNFDRVTLDARRFRLHVSEGDEHFSLGRNQEALAHYRMAESLYGGQVGFCSQIEPWLQQHAVAYASLYEGVLQRLVVLHRRAEDRERVQAYETSAARKLQPPQPLTTRAC